MDINVSEDLQTVVDGTVLFFKGRASVFQSVDSWEKINDMSIGDKVTAAGPPKQCDGYTMIPIRPKGAVDANEVTTQKDSIDPVGLADCMLPADMREPFRQRTCWHYLRGYCARGTACKWPHVLTPNLLPNANSVLKWNGTKAEGMANGGESGANSSMPEPLAKMMRSADADSQAPPPWAAWDIDDGVTLIATEELQIFVSRGSVVPIGRVKKGEEVIAAGKPTAGQSPEGLKQTLLPVFPKGFVAMSGLKPKYLDLVTGNEESEAAWDCPECGVINRSFCKQCASCRAAKPPKRPRGDAGPDSRAKRAWRGWKTADKETFNPTKFSAGTMVRIDGLVAKPELNGRIVECELYDAQTGRWQVLTSDDTRFKLKEANLILTKSWQTSFKL